MGVVAPWHVGTSQIRARTCVYCIGRWIIIIIIIFFTTEPPGKPLEDPAFLIESPSLFRRAVTAQKSLPMSPRGSLRFFFELLKCSVLMILVKPRRLTYSSSMTINPFLVKF